MTHQISKLWPITGAGPVAEAGVPGFSVESWQGYFVPAGTPAAVVARLRADADIYGQLVEDAAAFAAYCDDMAHDGTWGDELTLAAAADAFGVEVHVVQDTAANWHVAYAPTHAEDEDEDAPPRKTRRVFVAYTAPVHYDAIELA